MQLNFTGQGIEITEALRDLIEKKFDRLKSHFNGFITSGNVILSTQKINNTAEIVLHTKGAEIAAKATEEDMYKAIDQMLLKLETQLKKHKEKMSGHRE